MGTPGLDPPENPASPVEPLDTASPPAPPASVAPAGPSPIPRARAVAEAFLCSSYPTQFLAAMLLAALGVRSNGGSGLDATFVIAVSTLDAALVVALITYFLRREGESLWRLIVGTRSILREAAVGVALVVPVTLGVAAVVLGVRALWPSLHNVSVNPLTAFMTTPRLAILFAVVVVLAGGVREELQRAFQLHRLTPTVMPPVVALLVTSLAFGLGHTVQGRDVAVATFVLGALWGAMWLRRRSLVAAAVCHALFNLGQVAAGFAAANAGAPAP